MKTFIICCDIVYWMCIIVCIIARIDHLNNIRDRYHQSQIYNRQRRELNRFPDIDEMTPFAVIIAIEEISQLLFAILGVFSTQCVFFTAMIATYFVPVHRKWWYTTRVALCGILMLAALVNRAIGIVELPVINI